MAARRRQHWFGTTHLGQDIFSQVLVGTRSVVFVGLLAGVVAIVLAVLIGVTRRLPRRRADDGLSALSNVFLVIPALPLIIIITSTLPNARRLAGRARHRLHLVGVGRPRAAGADTVVAPPRLRGGRPGHR